MANICRRCLLGLTLKDSWPWICQCPIPDLKEVEDENKEARV